MSIMIHKNSEIEMKGQNLKTSMQVVTENETYRFEVFINFSNGNLDFFPKIIKKNVLFPFATDLISVSALSTYKDSITFQIPKKSG